MGYIDNTLVTIDAIVTARGRELLSKGRAKFKVSKFAVADDEVDYRLWDTNNTNGSVYYGQAIENMSLTEANPNQDTTMNFKMLSLPKNIEVVPTIALSGGKYSQFMLCKIPDVGNPTYPYANAEALRPVTYNPSDANITSGYTAIVSDRNILRIEGYGNKFSPATGGTTWASNNGGFVIDPSTGKYTVRATGQFFEINLAQYVKPGETETASVTIIANDTAGKFIVNFTVWNPGSSPIPSGGGGGGCFAAGAKVVTKNRGIVNIEDLKIGEKVQTERGWSKIWGYQTYTHNSEMDFMVIKHAEDQIKLSTLHYIYVNNKPVFAKDVKVGDKIKYKGKYVKVSEVSNKRSKGIYSPMTINGRINVNDIDCSIYTDVPHFLTYPLNKIARIIFLLFPKERYKYFNMKPVNKDSKQLLQGMHKWMYIFGRLTGVTDKAKIEERLTLEELRNEKK